MMNELYSIPNKMLKDSLSRIDNVDFTELNPVQRDFFIKQREKIKQQMGKINLDAGANNENIKDSLNRVLLETQEFIKQK